MKTIASVVLVLFLGGGAAAQAPGPGEEFDIEAALRQIERLMKEAEESLIRTTTGEESLETSRKIVEEIEKLLGGGQKKGRAIVDKINEVLENLPQSGGGGGGQGEMPKPDDQQKQEQQKQEDLRDRDPRNSKEGDPENGEKEKDPHPDTEPAKQPPPQDPKERVEVDPVKEWLARLPAQDREDILNGKFERVPEKWRAVIEAWWKKMSEIEDE